MLVLTTYDTDDDVFRALRAGATGFLLKDVHREDLVEAVRSVARGDSLLSPTVTRRLIEHALSLPDAARGTGRPLDAPSPRENEILRLVAGGLSNAEIADRLVIGEDDRQDACREHPDQARPPQPGAGGRHGVRDGLVSPGQVER